MKKNRRNRKSKENNEIHSDNKISPQNEEEKSKKYSVDQLLDKAEELISSMQFELAEQFCERALSRDPNSDRALTILGVMFVEAGEPKKATEILLKACGNFLENQNEEKNFNYTKFLYLGQLLGGAKALELYTKALEIMDFLLEKQKNCLPGAVKNEVQPEDISSTCCAIAELYMTDLCETSDAEQKCEKVLMKAKEAVPNSPEVFQTFASFLISAQRKEEAQEMLKESLKIWLPQLQAALGVGSDSVEPSSSGGVLIECPLDFDARLSCAKLLVETELYEDCESVLDTLIAENDESFEAWYIFGWLRYLQGEDYTEEAVAYLDQAKELIASTANCDEEIVQHIENLLSELHERNPAKNSDNNKNNSVEKMDT